MESSSLKITGHLERIELGTGEVSSPCLDIAFDERAGLVRIYDPRLFQAGRRDFCLRLLEAASHQPGVHKAEIDLASASCQVEFDPGSNAPRSMADAIVDAVREAVAGASWVDRIAWWRRRRRWTTLTIFRHPDGASLWETVGVEPNRIRMRRPGVAGDRSRLSHLADTLADLEGVETCHVSPWFHRITIEARLDSPLPDRFLDTLEQALVDLQAGDQPQPEGRGLARADGADGELATIADGWKRLVFLGIAGGSFAMTIVALAVPGVPTVPFLLATSYYLARSSPRLDDRLRHSPFFGSILQEWELRGGLSRASKGKLAGLTLAIVGVTVLLAGLTPVALLVIVLISSLSIYGIARMPELPEGPEDEPMLNGRASLALATP